MDSKIKLKIICLFILLSSCVNSKMKLDFKTAIGEYYSNSYRGIERLELKKDSTYVYEFIRKGQIDSFKNTGTWVFERDFDKDWGMSSIKFINWKDKSLIGYSSEKEYLDEFSRLSDKQKESLFGPKTLYIWFTTDVFSFKKKYVLRRVIDNQEEYDFVKVGNGTE